MGAKFNDPVFVYVRQDSGTVTTLREVREYHEVYRCYGKLKAVRATRYSENRAAFGTENAVSHTLVMRRPALDTTTGDLFVLVKQFAGDLWFKVQSNIVSEDTRMITFNLMSRALPEADVVEVTSDGI